MIKYVVGDATEPEISNNMKFIIHVCNDINIFGAGFAKVLTDKWPQTKINYHRWFDDQEYLKKINGSLPVLGEIQFIHVGCEPANFLLADLLVVNMIAQKGLPQYNAPSPISLSDLEKCLWKVREAAQSFEASIHFPRIGCGIDRMTWDKIEPLLLKCLSELDVTVYDLPKIHD